MALSCEETLRRLAFVRYLFLQADRQAQQPEPMAAAAVLMLHDCAEMFVQLVAEHLDVHMGKKADFLAYWDKIDVLTHREGMKRLNTLRVALKHSGVIPVNAAIPLRTTVDDFLLENTRTVFDRDWATISMTDLIAIPVVREHLDLALEQQERGDHVEALASVAKAFYELIHNSEVRHASGLGLHTGGLEFLSHIPDTHSMQIHDRDLHRFVQTTKTAIEKLQERMQLLILGVDLRAYQRFVFLTPVIMRVMDGKGTLHVGWTRPADTSSTTFQFLFDFVVETALGIQQAGNPLATPPAAPTQTASD